ncbi:MAG TPA: UvrD-helicase domain-containing protein, partial [bacterium]|nr:UvrD-helicase domain-containing protein [bacterium]
MARKDKQPPQAELPLVKATKPATTAKSAKKARSQPPAPDTPSLLTENRDGLRFPPTAADTAPAGSRSGKLPFIVYSSSAGSGKTYTLVKEYLKLVITHPGKHNNILAITFTNKAAAEMKERIVARLKAMAADDDPDLLSAIAAETGIPAETVRARVPLVLSTILHKYSDFAVMTIDSFIYRVVRSFAVELNLPLNAQVELNIPAITRTAVDSLIALCGKDAQVQQFLVDFVIRRLDEGGSWNIEGDLQKFARELFAEGSHDKLEKLAGVIFAATVADLDAKRSAAMAALKSIAQEAQAFNAAHGTLFLRPNSSGPTTMAKFASAGDASRIADLTGKLVDKDFALGKKAGDADEMRQREALALRDRLLPAAQTYLTLSHIDHFIYAMALLGKLTGIVDNYCREAAVVPIADFNRLVADIIRDEFIPFIYWRVGEKYEHYLIDEFQDTSRLQWHNLLPLIDNALATNKRNLVVGDPKQAIYRWRSGDATIMVDDIPRHFNDQQQNEQLGTNRRSLPAIINFNNAFFAAAAAACEDAPKLLRDIYTDTGITQQSHRTGEGYVELQLIPKTGGEPLRWLVDNIKTILADQHGYTAGDIAVLVRSRDQGQRVADALFADNIRVLSSEALLLSAQPVVVFLVNAMRHLVTSSYIELAALILFHRQRNSATADVAAELAAARAEGTAAMLKLLPDEYADRQGQLRRKPLYEVAEDLIRIFSLAAEPGDHAALQGFLDVVHTYATREGSDIARFLEWWDTVNEDAPPALQAPAGSDAVTVLTIHKAKGLEFPIVFIPFAGW